MRSHQLDLQRVITLGKGVITELKIGQCLPPPPNPSPLVVIDKAATRRQKGINVGKIAGSCCVPQLQCSNVEVNHV